MDRQEELERLVAEQRKDLSLGGYQPPETIRGYGDVVHLSPGMLARIDEHGRYRTPSNTREMSENYASCPVHGRRMMFNAQCRSCKSEQQRVRRLTDATMREKDNARRTAQKRAKRKADPEWAKQQDKRAHNRQRERYQTDPEYRERVLAKNRAAYAKRVASKRNAV